MWTQLLLLIVQHNARPLSTTLTNQSITCYSASERISAGARARRYLSTRIRRAGAQAIAEVAGRPRPVAQRPGRGRSESAAAGRRWWNFGLLCRYVRIHGGIVDLRP